MLKARSTLHAPARAPSMQVVQPILVHIFIVAHAQSCYDESEPWSSNVAGSRATRRSGKLLACLNTILANMLKDC